MTKIIEKKKDYYHIYVETLFRKYWMVKHQKTIKEKSDTEKKLGIMHKQRNFIISVRLKFICMLSIKLILR